MPFSRNGWTRRLTGTWGEDDVAFVETDFAPLAHIHQIPPRLGNDGTPWTTWLLLGGRGAGKTRTGAEWVRAQVYGHAPYAARPHGSLALVGETEHDVREVMIDGPAGLLHTGPEHERP